MAFFLYKGLKKPLIFFGLKDKYIYYALLSVVIGLFLGGFCNTLFTGGIAIGFIVGGLGVWGTFYLQEKRGLYDKTKNSGEMHIFIPRIKKRKYRKNQKPQFP